MRVLFVCTGNTCRSPMAEGIFNHIAKQNKSGHTAISAGIFPDGNGAHANAVTVLLEMGIDISAHQSQGLSQLLIENADVIITMTKSHKSMVEQLPEAAGKVQTMGEYSGTGIDIADPFGGDLEQYRSCALDILQAVQRMIERGD